MAANNTTGKVLKAMGLFSGVQAIGIVCSIIRAKFIAIWIGPAGVGLFAIFNNALDLLSSATQLNFRQSAVRDISSSPASKLGATAGALRWWARRLGFIGAVAIAALSPLLSNISFGNTGYWWAFACLAVAMFALAVTNGEQALLQGTGRLRALAKSTVAGAVAGTAVSVPLYYFLGESSIIPSIIIFAIAGMAAVMMVSRPESAPCRRSQRNELGKSFLKLGAYLTVSSVAAYLASYIFLAYLTRTYSEQATGIYQAGYTLVIRYTGIVFTALSMEYFPRMVNAAMRPAHASVLVSHEMLLVLYVLTPLIVLFVCADQLAINLLYTSEFLAALPFVTIGMGAMVFRAISYCMAYVIIARGDGRTFIICELTSAAIGLALNILFFRQWGFSGLGVSYILWYLVYTIIIGIVYRRYGMRVSTAALRMSVTAMVLVAASIVLKHFGWWAVIPVFALSAAVSAKGYKAISKRKPVKN